MKVHRVAAGTTRETKDFRAALVTELSRRCARNPRYSLRTFAQNLGIDHSTLSQILRGRRRITPTTIRRLGTKLGLTPAAIDGYLGATPAAAPSLEVRQLREVAEDAAAILSDWHHFAILELIRLDSFVPDVRWIARVLGTTADRVNVALQHLLRFGLLRMESPTRWVDALGDVVLTEHDLSRAALDRLLAELGGLARQSPAAVRHGSATFAIPSAALPRLLERIDRWLESLGPLTSDSGGDTLCRLDLYLTRLTR